MASIFQSLLLVIATSSQRELARQIKYLKVENQILRSRLPARITVTAKERERLLKFGARLGRALQELVAIVAPGTFLRWIREAKKDKKRSTAKRGRRRTAEDIRKLILLMARDNGCRSRPGYEVHPLVRPGAETQARPHREDCALRS